MESQAKNTVLLREVVSQHDEHWVLSKKKIVFRNGSFGVLKHCLFIMKARVKHTLCPFL